MEIDRAHCFICEKILVSFDNNLAEVTGIYSTTPLLELLERLLNEKLTEPDQCCCEECVKKLNDYDLATLTALNIENELSILYRKKNSTYYLEDDDDEVDTVEAELLNEEDLEHAVNEDVQLMEDEEHHILMELIDTQNADGVTEAEYLIYDVVDANNDEAIDAPVTVKKKLRNRPTKLANDNADDTDDADIDGEQNDVVVTKVGTGKKSRCLKCNIVFNTKIERTRHMKIHRKKNGLECSICGRSYKSRAALDIHVGMHSGISPYECQVCGKQFTQKGALVRHMPMHTGEHPYQVSLQGII